MVQRILQHTHVHDMKLSGHPNKSLSSSSKECCRPTTRNYARHMTQKKSHQLDQSKVCAYQLNANDSLVAHIIPPVSSNLAGDTFCLGKARPTYNVATVACLRTQRTRAAVRRSERRHRQAVEQPVRTNGAKMKGSSFTCQQSTITAHCSL